MGRVWCGNGTRAEKPEMAWGTRALCAIGGDAQTMLMVQVCCLHPTFPFMPAPTFSPSRRTSWIAVVRGFLQVMAVTN